MKIWIYTSTDDNSILDGGGYPVRLGDIPPQKWANNTTSPALRFPSAKMTVWADHAAALAFMQKHHKGRKIKDLGHRIEVKMPKDHLPTRTLAMVEVEVAFP